ncbi:hypothetical protein EYC84_001770 [Monilinia fructicola]|nr:hypothetical protein EYC84_001770 [Monilinia fructicola]
MSLSHVVNYPVSGPRPQSLADQFAHAEAGSSSPGVHAELQAYVYLTDCHAGVWDGMGWEEYLCDHVECKWRHNGRDYFTSTAYLLKDGLWTAALSHTFWKHKCTGRIQKAADNFYLGGDLIPEREERYPEGS